MSDMKFTPHPWNRDSGFCKEIRGINGWLVAKVTAPDTRLRGKDWKEEDEYCEGNANLIAAAPELLEALKLLYDEICINNLGDLFDTQDIHMARDAIAKASGKAEGKS